MEAIRALRSAVSDGKDGFTLINSSKENSNLKEAKFLRINETGAEYDLDSKTAFQSSNSELGFIDLRTIVNCWQCRSMTVPQYIATSDELGIPNLKFLERADLIEWLEGSSTESEFIKESSEDAGTGKASEQGDVDMLGSELSAAEAEIDRGRLVDHATVLHGQKLNDFANVATIAHKTLVSEFRNAGRPSGSAGRPVASSSMDSSKASVMTPLKPTKGKDPIILLSPSPSSLLNMANIQQFLEKGVYAPTLKSPNSPNLLRITRSSKVIGPKTKFIVVDSVDQFKPDYWDRVVAVFVTGQQWQLRSYKWQDPNSLFQHVVGLALVYKNDPVPEPLLQWNVKVEPIDRNARFRDREVVERIWERIEAHMIARGWPVSVSV